MQSQIRCQKQLTLTVTPRDSTGLTWHLILARPWQQLAKPSKALQLPALGAPQKMRWEQGIRRVRESPVRAAEWVGWEEIPGQGLSFSKGPDRLPSTRAATDTGGGTPRRGILSCPFWALNDPRPTAAFQLTDVPTAAAHLSVNSQQCWALWF